MDATDTTARDRFAAEMVAALFQPQAGAPGPTLTLPPEAVSLLLTAAWEIGLYHSMARQRREKLELQILSHAAKL